MVKEHIGQSFLRFQICQQVDVSSAVPAPATTLIRGLYPRCVCFHPSKPLMAVGVSGYLAVYDMQTNTRLGQVDLKSVPIEMGFTPEGSLIIVVVQDWIMYAVSTTSWKARQLVPRRAKMDKPLESCLLAVAPGHNPFIYFCRYAKDMLRLATLPSRAGGGPVDGGGTDTSVSSSSGGGWGSRVKLNVQKAILGLTCHHVDMQLLMLTADGQLRGYAIVGPGGDALTPIYAVPVQEASDTVAPTAGILSCVPHQGVPGRAIILQGSRTTGTITVLETTGRAAPVRIFQGQLQGHFSTLGMGVCQTLNTLLVFGHGEGGRVRCTAWRLAHKPGVMGATLKPTRVDPQDISPLLDGGRRTRVALAGSLANGVWAAGSGVGPAHSGSSAAPAASAAALCSGLWGLTPGWMLETSGTYLLEGTPMMSQRMEPQLGPHVGRVLVHPALGLLAVVRVPSYSLQANRALAFEGRGDLSTEEIALARRTATIVLMMVNNLEAHAGGWRGARVAQQHTPLTAWIPPAQQQLQLQPEATPVADSSDDELVAAVVPALLPPAEGISAALEGGALPLPPHVYYLAGNRLMKYALVTRSANSLVTLPPTDTPDGDLRVARQVVHSSLAGAWLVFFESGVTGATTGGTGGGVGVGSGGGAGTAAAAAAVGDHFSWTLVNAATFTEEGGSGSVMWVRAGKSGCFVGPDDSHFCVMSSNGRLLEVFVTTANSSAMAGGSPLLTLTLEGAMLVHGLGSSVFPGPPLTNAPVPEARAPPEASEQDPRRFRGSGVVMWQSADMALSLVTLPSLSRVPLDPLSAPTPDSRTVAATSTATGAHPGSDSSDAPPIYPTLLHGHHFGLLQRQAHLPMGPQEIVIHVAWQSLTLARAIGSGAASGDSPSDAVAAVLTSQRLLLVTAGLRVVCSVSLASYASAVMLEPLTSLVWAGPMLLVSTAAGQVLQLTWTGTLLPVATMSPTGYMALVGVTSDALLLLRTPLAVPTVVMASAAAPGSLAEVVARPAALIQPLIIGWASLAATGLLSHGSGSSTFIRPALQHALSLYDAMSFTPRGIWALIAAGAWDVAAAVAAHMPPLDGAVRLAAAAAAGDWSEVAATLLAEASRALHAPAPPPRGSGLHCKLVAAGAGALFHGQLATSASLFQAAGEWPAAMILAVCQGNSQGLAAIVQKVVQPGDGATTTSSEGHLAAQLASALRNVYGGVGTQVGDVPLTLALPGPRPGMSEPLERADCWAMAAPMAASAAVAVPLGLPRAVLPDVELGSIPPCVDRGCAVPYYGLTASAAASVTVAAAATAGRPLTVAPAASMDRSGASVTGSSGYRPGGSTALGDLEATSVDSNEGAQAAARAEFLNHLAGGPGGGGSAGFGRGPTVDFSSDDDDTASEATCSAAETQGGIQRRIKVQIRDPKAATSSVTTSLREAANNIRVAPPPAATATSRLPAAHLPVPQPSLTSFGSSSSNVSVQFPPGISSAQLYAGGVAMMESGDWRGSAAHFSRAMSVLQHEERATLDEASRRSRLAFCAQYYAAVRLLEAVGSGVGPREARLYRYLAGLNLDAKHSTALLHQSVTRNRTVGNYKYAGDQLTALIVKVADTSAPEYLAHLQAEIEECDRHGGRNAGLPADEQVEDWALLVARAGESVAVVTGPGRCGKEEVDDLVLPLLN